MAQPQAGYSNIKILSVAWYKILPPKFGGQKAVALFNEYLGELAPLHCLCSKNNEVDKASYHIHPVLPVSKTQFTNPLIWWKIYGFAKRNHITHLVLEFPYHAMAGFFCKKFLGIKLVINTHNIEFMRFKEQNKWWWGLLYHFEKWALRKADLVFFKTGNDKTAAQNQFGLNESKLEVIPYGVNNPKPFFKQEAKNVIRETYNISSEEKILLFAGTLDYEPNAQAVIAIKEHIIPLLKQTGHSFKIIACGRNQNKCFQLLNEITDPHLVMAGDVQDIDTYFKATDIFINPVRRGGGIQTKIIDALSYHLNVVCFESKAISGSNAENKLFIAKDEDWNAFVSLIKQALDKTGETPAAFFENFNWRTIAAKAYSRMISV